MKHAPRVTTRRQRIACRSRGFTLVELMMALAITALIGAAVTAMMFGVSHGTNESKDVRGLALRCKAINARLSACIRTARAVLDADDDRLILWTGDANDNGLPDLSEVHRIARDTDTGDLTSYTFADDGTDVEHQLGDDFDTATTNAIDSGDMTGAVWAQAVSGFDITLDDSTAQSADLVSFRLTLVAGNLSDVTINAAALRNKSSS